MSLDSQSPQAPYESSSFATPQAGAEQPVLKLARLMSSLPRKALLCPFRGKVVAPATKGGWLLQAAYILIAAKGGDTTTLSGEAAVKPTPSGRKPRQS